METFAITKNSLQIYLNVIVISFDERIILRESIKYHKLFQKQINYENQYIFRHGHDENGNKIVDSCTLTLKLFLIIIRSLI